MTEVETKSLPSSLSSQSVVLVAGLLATQLFLNQISPSGEDKGRVAPFLDYTLSPSTYGEHADLFASGQLASSAESALETFYADLMARQERLGREFEQVLFENLWKLYAR
jgi:hypothetical protein